MRNKRGQFYIIAAVIIVTVVLSITSIATYSILKSEPRAIKDLGSDLREEPPRIIAYGVYNGKNVTALLQNFTEKDFADYFALTTDPLNATFVYGNKTDLYVIVYSKEDSGAICIGKTCSIQISPVVKKEEIKVSLGQESVTVNLLGKDYPFNLNADEMFYFLLKKQEKGETYVDLNSLKAKQKESDFEKDNLNSQNENNNLDNKEVKDEKSKKEKN